MTANRADNASYRTSSADRMRAKRERDRRARAQAWTRQDPQLAPVLAAWAGLGLRWAPSDAQRELIVAETPTMQDRMAAASILRRLPRARATRGYSAVYNLVRSLLDAIRAGRRPKAPSTDQVRASRPVAVGLAGRDDAQQTARGAPSSSGAVLGRLLAAGLDPALARELGS